MAQIALRIFSPVVLSAMLFKLTQHPGVSRIRLIHPVFQARLLSSVIFCTSAFAFPKADHNFNYLKMDFTGWQAGVLFTVIFSGMAIWVSYHIALRTIHLKLYPQLRSLQWSSSLLVSNALSWTIYLLGYEMFFRGFLLFSALEILPVTSAFAVNLIVYSAAHFRKGWKESLMAVPFGLLLCLMTFYTGNIWSAFIIHASLALSNDWFAIKIQSALSNPTNTIVRL